MRCRVWATTAVLLVAAGGIAPVAAQPLPLAPDGPPPLAQTAPDAPARTAASPTPPPPVLGAPVAVLGSPVHATDELPTRPASSLPSETRTTGRAATLGVPTTSTPVSASAVEGRSTATSGPPADPVNDFLLRRPKSRDGADGETTRTLPPPRSSARWEEKLDGFVDVCKERFKSDHAFDGFISPVTNPFLFEDPRSLTEVRPIFLYQQVPSGQPDFQGGSLTYFGVQGRLAITERWSLVINKLGGISINPSGNSPFDGTSGFAELWLGPKYTFLRDEQCGRLMAGGLQFQIPTGNAGAFQSTGTLSLVPYVSFGQNFGKDWAVGSLNVLANTGYALSVNNSRSDYWYLSGHLDLDVCNWHRFYPLIELNYFLYTTNGNSFPVGSEGRDLINFGGQAQGNGLLTGAIGARFKITESAQIGGAFEVPLAGPKDLFSYRFTIDFILRY